MEFAMRFEKAFLGDIEVGKLGIWLFILSGMLLFGAFFSSYVMLRLGSSVCALV